MRAFSYARADSPAGALAEHLASPGAEYVAGGTTLVDLLKLDVLRLGRLVDLNRLPLERIEARPDGGIRIGALVRNSDLARHAEVRSRYPVLAEALLTGASAQLRNMATTAGNLLQRTRCPYYRDGFSACNKRDPGRGCAAMEGYHRSHAILGTSDACIATHPSDMCVALAVLDPVVVTLSGKGERRIPFGDLHLLPGDTPDREFALLPGELITAVDLPPPPDGARSWYRKVRDRESFEFALASAAVLLVLDGPRIRTARVALGGVGTKPWRCGDAEALLRGRVAEEAAFLQAADAALAGATVRRDNAFKVELARRVLVRALTEAAAGQPQVREI